MLLIICHIDFTMIVMDASYISLSAQAQLLTACRGHRGTGTGTAIGTGSDYGSDYQSTGTGGGIKSKIPGTAEFARGSGTDARGLGTGSGSGPGVNNGTSTGSGSHLGRDAAAGMLQCCHCVLSAAISLL